MLGRDGDFTAISLNLGYLDAGILFTIVILIPALAHWQFGLNGIAAFWMSYIVTRPLGASFADYISKPKNTSGLNFGDGPTAIMFALAVLVLVTYLALARPDIQKPLEVSTAAQKRSTPALPDLPTWASPSSRWTSEALQCTGAIRPIRSERCSQG